MASPARTRFTAAGLRSRTHGRSCIGHGHAEEHARKPAFRAPTLLRAVVSRVSALSPGAVRPSSGAVPLRYRSWRCILPFQLLVW
ncbi:hypothetical protein [Azospirillum largimobile]